MTLLHLVRLLKRSAQDKASIGQEAMRARVRAERARKERERRRLVNA